MASNANEYLWLVEESAYGTPVASPVVGTSQFLVPLVDSNSFAMTEDPEFQEIAYGGGLDVVADVVADTRTVKGSLSTLGYPLLTKWLLQAAVTRVNAGQTSPWVTTEPVNDLASISVYHLIRGRDGSWLSYSYPGTKIAGINLSVSRQDPKLKLKLDLVGQKEFPNAADSSAALTPPAAPTEAQYPRGPYLFSHTGGLVLLGGSALTRYTDLTVDIKNKLDPQCYESRWVQTLGAKGREATADAGLLLTSASNLRATYQAVTSQGLSVAFNDGTTTTTIAFNSNAHVNKLGFDLPLGKEFMQKATFRPKWDRSALTGAGADIIIS
jgi:hypothetical protein